MKFDLASAIRTIPDYPKPGIMFRDVTTLMGDDVEARRSFITRNAKDVRFLDV